MVVLHFYFFVLLGLLELSRATNAREVGEVENKKRKLSTIISNIRTEIENLKLKGSFLISGLNDLPSQWLTNWEPDEEEDRSSAELEAEYQSLISRIETLSMTIEDLEKRLKRTTHELDSLLIQH